MSKASIMICQMYFLFAELYKGQADFKWTWKKCFHFRKGFFTVRVVNPYQVVMVNTTESKRVSSPFQKKWKGELTHSTLPIPPIISVCTLYDFHLLTPSLAGITLQHFKLVSVHWSVLPTWLCGPIRFALLRVWKEPQKDFRRSVRSHSQWQPMTASSDVLWSFKVPDCYTGWAGW